MNDSILKDLEHKTKKVTDLIRFISNTAHCRDGENNNPYPNFSLLLGSGASVTSGIRSGRQLIKTWKQEIIAETGRSDIEEYLKGCNWYDSTNEYSSLFEYRFDLQRQRRIFVEKEVADKAPSIGYAYLISLVNNGWFNTIFTTNFDDLINESFYRFSKRRPIVCAHDSSISAVTITSDRPKIIKLHGDYLFDNIKATLRETESLEVNMRMKIREFAKNCGLIVVGYSGQDRSVMDILTALVSQPDYFKNGIYWCVLEKDINDIGSELKKFLWRDRVYLVTIDGFDEMMAELNQSLNEGALPIRNELLSREHHDEIVRGLTNNPFIANTRSEILKDDCKKLNDSVDKNLVEDYLHFINHKREENKQNTPRESEPQYKTGLLAISEKEKMQIQEWATEAYIAGHRQKVLKEIGSFDILSMPDSQYKLDLLELYIELSSDLSDEEIIRYHNELIRLNPKNQMYYMVAASRIKRLSQKINFLKLATTYFPNDPYVYNRYVEQLIDYKRGGGLDEEIEVKNDDIEDAIANSLVLNKWPSNNIWISKSRWLMYKYKNDNKTKTKECTELIDDLESMHFKHPNMLEVLCICDSKKLNESYFKEYIEFYTNADNVEYLERCYIIYIEWLQDHKEFEDVKKVMNEYEEMITPSNSYLRCKIRFLERFTLYENALSILDQLRTTNDDRLTKMRILAKLKRNDDLVKYYKTIKHPTHTMNLMYSELTGDYKEIEKYYEDKIQKNEYMSLYDISQFSYSLLQTGNYQRCYNYLSQFYSNPETCEPVVIVNYLMSKKLRSSGVSIENDVKKKITERDFIQFDDSVMAAGYSLLQDKPNMMKHIKKELKKNPDFIYFCETWPVLKLTLKEEDYLNLNKYIKDMNISI